MDHNVVHPIFQPVLRAIAPRVPAPQPQQVKAENRADAGGLLFQFARDVENGSDGLARLGHYEPTLTNPTLAWTAQLRQIEREMRAAALLLQAGYGVNEALPDTAEPHLQGLIRCRADCPSPSYDSHYRVKVSRGRALIVHTPHHGFDPDYFEWVAGVPMQPAPTLTLAGINAKVPA